MPEQRAWGGGTHNTQPRGWKVTSTEANSRCIALLSVPRPMQGHFKIGRHCGFHCQMKRALCPFVFVRLAVCCMAAIRDILSGFGGTGTLPVKILRTCPDLLLQMMVLWSCPPVTTRSPSGNQAPATTHLSCSLSTGACSSALDSRRVTGCGSRLATERRLQQTRRAACSYALSLVHTAGPTAARKRNARAAAWSTREHSSKTKEAGDRNDQMHTRDGAHRAASGRLWTRT